MRKEYIEELANQVILGLAQMPRDNNGRVRGKAWLAENLGISRVTLNERIRMDRFTDSEVETMRNLGVIE